jgi:hypothetical protein
LIAVFALGGTFLYTRFANSVKQEAQPYHVELADETFSLELTRTFTATPANEAQLAAVPLESDSELDSAAILVLLKGVPILIKLGEVPAGEKLVLDKIPDVELGLNEIFVKARLLPPQPGELAAMQIRILNRGHVLAESVFTGYPDSPLIYGTLTFEATSPDKE